MIIQVTPTIRRKKKGTPVYSGVVKRKISTASVKDSLETLNEMSNFDKQVQELRERWNL